MSSKVILGLVVLGVLAFAPAATAAPLYSDPLGDTFNTGTLDVVSYVGDLGVVQNHVYFAVNFSGAVSAPSAFAPNSVVGFLDLDTDRNASTGGTTPWGGLVTGGNSWMNFFIPPNTGSPSIPGPTIGLGSEFYVNLGSELSHPGFVDVLETGGNTVVGTVPIVFSGNGFSLAIPLAMLGNPGNPAFYFGGVVGTFTSPTDRFPNGSVAAVVTPEPSSLVLFGACGLAVWGFLRRRRARQ